jgi:hypothetical protein
VAHDVRSTLLVARGLLHIDVLFQLTVEESGFYIQLAKLQVLRCYQGEQCPQCGVLAHRGIGVVEVHALTLHEALDHQPGLVALDVAVGVQLDLEDPFGRQRLDSTWQLLQSPGAVGEK